MARKSVIKNLRISVCLPHGKAYPYCGCRFSAIYLSPSSLKLWSFQSIKGKGSGLLFSAGYEKNKAHSMELTYIFFLCFSYGFLRKRSYAYCMTAVPVYSAYQKSRLTVRWRELKTEVFFWLMKAIPWFLTGYIWGQSHLSVRLNLLLLKTNRDRNKETRHSNKPANSYITQ